MEYIKNSGVYLMEYIKNSGVYLMEYINFLYINYMNSQFLLLEITTADSDNTRPHLNIDKTVVETSASRAALTFMAMAFSGKKTQIQARIKIQNTSGNIRSFNILRRPVADKFGTIKYKHHIV